MPINADGSPAQSASLSDDRSANPAGLAPGIIMAQGKITLGSGAQLISSPLEAAKVFQAMDSQTGESVSPKNFFWEGDKYVLGNTTTTGTTSGSNLADSTYDLAECVTYENWKKK